MIESIKKVGILKYIILLLLSTFWVIVEAIPYVPIGLIIAIYLVRKQGLKAYTPLVLMAIVGFVGTGFYFTIFKEQRYMQQTEKIIQMQKFKFGYRVGIDTIGYLYLRYEINENSAIYSGKKVQPTIYSDKNHTKEVEVGQAYVSQFEESYRNNSADFMIDTFVYQRGITKEQVEKLFKKLKEDTVALKGSSYIGYLYWNYPSRPEHKEISLFYNMEFEKNNDKYKTFIYRLVLDENGTKLTQFGARDDSVEYLIQK